MSAGDNPEHERDAESARDIITVGDDGANLFTLTFSLGFLNCFRVLRGLSIGSLIGTVWAVEARLKVTADGSAGHIVINLNFTRRHQLLILILIAHIRRQILTLIASVSGLFLLECLRLGLAELNNLLAGAFDVHVFTRDAQQKYNVRSEQYGLNIEGPAPSNITLDTGSHSVTDDGAQWVGHDEKCEPEGLLTFVAEHVGPDWHVNSEEHLQQAGHHAHE